MGISEYRFQSVFDTLTTDGRTPEGGLSRPAFSEKHLAARRRFADLSLEHGFAVHIDGAGNVSARYDTAGEDAPTLILGSHLDSVPDGGLFDGTLGVAAAFETMLSLRDLGTPLPANIEVIDFTDEEGTWVSLLGSRAASGALSEHDLDNPKGKGQAFEAALERAGLTRKGILGARRTGERFLAYLELHIEQGLRLISSKIDIGVVSGMVGIYKYLVTFYGTANHAGTTPMDRRRDAGLGASAFTLAVRDIAMDRFTDCAATVGNMEFAPGVFNIIPSWVACSLELRSSTAARARALATALREEAVVIADRFGLGLEVEFMQSVLPRMLDKHIQKEFALAAKDLGLRSRTLTSLAGHDAQSMAALGPSGLIFVPSVGGYSHSAHETTSWKDCVNGCNTLFGAARRLLDAAATNGA